MLKIYLDWNIITHLKSEGKDNREILNAIEEYGRYFIFPYSMGHMHDLYSGDSTNPGYWKDLKMLSKICSSHLLEYSNDIDSAYPYQCTPEEYIERNDSKLKLFKSGLSREAFEYFLDSMGINLSRFMKEMEEKELPPIDIPFLNVSVKNTKEALMAIMSLGEHYAKDNKLFARIEKYVKDNSDGYFGKIKSSNPDTIFCVLDELTHKQVDRSFVDIIKEVQTQRNSYSFFISLYLSLNATGFSSDKKKDIRNIYTDAEHAYYASKCDIFVTNDGNLKEKAEAIYHKFGIKTRVIEKSELVRIMKEENTMEYDDDYFYNYILPEFGKPCKVDDVNSYFKEMPYRFWGLFNCCEEINLPDTTYMSVVYRLRIPEKGYVYYTELNRFFDYIESLLYEDGIELFRKRYRKLFDTRKREWIINAEFNFYYADYLILLKADKDTDIPLPLMIIIKME